MLSNLIYLNESLSILVTIFVISLVFGSIHLLLGDYIRFIIVSSVVSLSIIIHELAHKYVAISLGCYSRYVLHPLGLVLTLISAIPFIPIKIIMPGVTLVSLYTYDPFTFRKINGLTSIAGPLSNIILAIISIIIRIVAYPIMSPIWRSILYLMLRINSWIALFNLIPLPPLDGSKVINWKPTLWLSAFILSIILYIYSLM
ncbi:MAG: site-2 protease family protein [Desulfurococcaceae archaeon]